MQEDTSEKVLLPRSHVAEDIILIAVGVVLAIVFAKYNAVGVLIDMLGNTALSSFIVGIFFTSLFTIAPAAVLLVELALVGHPITVAFFGALGAVVGDMILFVFVRDRLSADIMRFVENGFKKFHFDRLHSKMFRWIFPLLGALIIASPLPDELGIMLLGFSHMKARHVIPISFLMNFIGVLLIIAAGQVISR
jgi:uncharacterized membrane protein YdjX (TVP38/TMEM64 family)